MNSTLKDQFFTKEGLMFAGSIAFVGGGIATLLKVLGKNKRFQLGNDTRDCVRASSGYAVGLWSLAVAPTFIVRRMGWNVVQPFYDFIFQNVYTGIVAVLIPTILAAYTLIIPSEERSARRRYAALSSLALGTVAAPLFHKPKDFVTIAACYTGGLSIPILASMSFSKDLIMHNVLAPLLMCLGTAFAHEWAIPFIIRRRREAAMSGGVLNASYWGNMFGSTVADTSRTLMLSVVACVGFFSLLMSNTHILFIERSFENAKKPSYQPKKRYTTKGQPANGSSTSLTERKDWWHIIDGTDELTNGILSALAIFYTFSALLVKTYKLLRKVLRKENNGQKLVQEDNVLESLISSLIK